MRTHASRAANARTTAIAFVVATTFALGAAAQPTEHETAPRSGAQPVQTTHDDDVELPPEVRSLLGEEPDLAIPQQAPEASVPSEDWTPAPALPLPPADVWAPGPRRPDATSLATSSSTDSFVATSAGALIAGGALGALGVVLFTLEDEERICGRLAGCVEAPAKSSRSREGAGYGLLGAGVGASLTGGLSLLISLAAPPEHSRARSASTQGAIGIGLTSAGGALLGGGIAAELAGDQRVDDGIVPALVTTGLASAGVGAILLLTRLADDDEASTPSAGSPLPSFSVGLGGAEASWSF